MNGWILTLDGRLVNKDFIISIDYSNINSASLWCAYAETENETFKISRGYKTKKEAIEYVHNYILRQSLSSVAIHIKDVPITDLYEKCVDEIAEKSEEGRRLSSINFSRMEDECGYCHAFLVFEDR